MGGICSLIPAGQRCTLPRLDDTDKAKQKQASAALMDAVRAAHMGHCQRCLLDGAAANSCDEHGWAPLHFSAAAGRVELCRLLLDFDADVNATLPDLSTPLMLAAEEAHMPVAQLLLERGALTLCKDEDGFTVMSRCDKRVEAELRSLIGTLACDAGGEVIIGR
mmetsp:Transcript_56410/g.132298  ORF Transcript_56410/g.132298 Transcript_56410/m.132298 type:complete len:164 (+) Transcript_56410:168-659(+)